MAEVSKVSSSVTVADEFAPFAFDSKAQRSSRAKFIEETPVTSARTRVILHTPEPQHGMAQYVSTLAKALARSAVPVVLFCPENFEGQAELRAAGVHIEHAAFRAVTNAGLAKRIWRNFRFAALSAPHQFRASRRTDIIHFQSMLHLPLGFVFFIAALLRRAAIVLTVHDPIPHRWRLPRGLKWLERKMLATAYRLSDEIIVHNSEGKHVMIREFHIPEKNISVIPHGHYSCAETQIEFPWFDCLRLLMFGSIRENKGVHLAIQAVRVVNARPGIPVQLTIAGRPYNAAEAKYWEECKKLIRGTGDGIQLIERHVAEEEIGPLFGRHHALLLPYTDFHSESGVALLALSHCRPILATTTGGLGDLTKAGACGVQITYANTEAVAAAISSAINLGSNQLREMGLRGSRFLRETRSWESIAQQTRKIYNSAARNRSPAALVH